MKRSAKKKRRPVGVDEFTELNRLAVAAAEDPEKAQLDKMDPVRFQELCALQQIRNLRAKEPDRAARYEAQFKRHLCTRPITEALGEVRLAFSAELEAQRKSLGADVWLNCLLFEAVWEARQQGNLDLLRVLTALKMVAGTTSDFAPLLKGCEGKTMLGIANKFLEEVGEAEGGVILSGAKRPLLLKEISRLFSPEPKAEREFILLRVVGGLAHILEAGSASDVLGVECRAGWVESVVKEVLDLRECGQDGDREPSHYVRAVLVGLGINRETAKDWVKGMRK